MKTGPSHKQTPVKPLQVFQSGTPGLDSRNTSQRSIKVEKMAVVPSLKSNFAKNNRPSVNFAFQNGHTKSLSVSNAVSPKSGSMTSRSSKRMEDIQPDNWEKAERQIRNYNKLMSVTRTRSPQFYVDRIGNLNNEVDDSDLKLRAKFAASWRLRSRDFGSSVSTLQNPEGGMAKPLHENLFNEQPKKILDVRKHDLESYNFRHEALENMTARDHIPKEFKHQQRDEKVLDIPKRKRNLSMHTNMFYNKFYYG